MNNIDVSIIIVTMNSMKTLPALLQSISNENTPAISFEIIVVDNCSTDGTREYIHANYQNIKIIENSEIKGFAENNNIGIKLSSGKIIALINPDIVISSEVFEHVADLWQGFREVHRVLKLDGVHIFTVPYYHEIKTRQRAKVDSDGKIIHFLPTEYHKDPLSLKGSFVFTDFGSDLIEKLELLGFKSIFLSIDSDNELGIKNTSAFLSKKV